MEHPKILFKQLLEHNVLHLQQQKYAPGSTTGSYHSPGATTGAYYAQNGEV